MALGTAGGGTTTGMGMGIGGGTTTGSRSSRKCRGSGGGTGAGLGHLGGDGGASWTVNLTTHFGTCDFIVSKNAMICRVQISIKCVCLPLADGFHLFAQINRPLLTQNASGGAGGSSSGGGGGTFSTWPQHGFLLPRMRRTRSNPLSTVCCRRFC